MQLETNRDLYLAVCELGKRYEADQIELLEYLCNVLDASDKFKDQEELSLDEFFELLRSGFETRLYTLLPESRLERKGNAGYEEWKRTILLQIADLGAMEKSGTLQDPQRYFGIPGPRGAYWCNFHPPGFLECGVAGYFSGWQPGDDSGRKSVDGPVAVIWEVGGLKNINP